MDKPVRKNELITYIDEVNMKNANIVKDFQIIT